MTRAPCSAAISDAKSPAAPAPTTIEVARLLGHGGYGTGVPQWFRHDAGLAHDIPGHPERPARITALEAELERHDWFGWERVEAPRATREQLERVHPAAHVDGIEALSAAGGGAIDMDTTVAPGTFEAALRAAGGAVALVDSLLAGGRAVRLLGAAAARGTTPRPRARWASASSTTSPWPRRTRGPRTASSGCRSSTGTCTTATGPTTSSTPTRPCSSAPSTSGRCIPGTGAACDVGFGAGDGLHGQPARCPRARATRCYGSLVEHVVAPLVAEYAPGLVLVSAGFDAHRADPLATSR